MSKKVPLTFGYIEQNNFRCHQLSSEEVRFYLGITVIIGVFQIDMSQFVGDSPVLSGLVRNTVVVEYEIFSLILYSVGFVKTLSFKV